MLLFFGNDELCSRRAAPATPKWSFLTIKKRLRQAASRGKWCFSSRNAILGKKKAPAASLQPEENGFGPPNKGATGSPQQRSHWCTPRREPLVLQMVKNTKIFTKWSSIQHFEMSPIPKCTVFKTLHESDRVIAPNPLK